PTYLDRFEVDLLFAEAERRADAGGFIETRDLAMLELFYSTGMRLAELAGLNDHDLDLVSDQVKVRGKGKKERIVPVGTHAEQALRRYFRHRDAVAAGAAGTADRRAVFVGRRGKRLTPRSVQLAVKRSEERRVGKECRSRWAQDVHKKNGDGAGICAAAGVHSGVLVLVRWY